MAEGAAVISQRLRDDLARLNATLEEAFAANIRVDLQVNERGVVGRLQPLVNVSGQASKSKIEFVERL